MNKWTRAFDWNHASAAPAGRRFAPGPHQYFAYLSYSHKDTAVADWLHQALEKFRVPRHLAGRLTEMGVVPKRLTPVFRDRHELAAASDLGTEIREALAASHFLIVLCSPAAAKSKWTNAEIDAFKKVRGDGCVIAAIIDGEPFASDLPGREKEECFPPALRHKYDRRGRATAKRAEPLAADLREDRDGRKLGLLKIIAGMLGVGLDDLVQRDHARRQRQLAIVAAGSLGGMLITSSLAFAAIQARDSARDQRRQAESLVGYMLGDLKDKLEPIGRLDILDGVGSRALAYYQNENMKDLSDDALAQRSKALTLLGQVASDRGDLDTALRDYRAAFAGTAEALRRSPNDPQRIYDHAQNVFYVGDIAHSRGQLPQAEAAMREYKRLATRLIATDPTNPKWQMEGIYADTDLGVLLDDEGRFSDAAAVFANALVDRERLARDDPSNVQYKKALFEGLAWVAQARQDEGRLQDALSAREQQIQLLAPIIADPHSDAEYLRQATVAYRMAGWINSAIGNSAEAVRQLRIALQIADRMTAVEPTNTKTLGQAAWARLDLARVELSLGSTDEAAGLVRDGCDLTKRLIAKDSTVEDWQLDLRTICGALQSRIALAQGDSADAESAASDLVAAMNAEVASANSSESRFSQAAAYMIQGLVWRAEKKRDAALAAFRRAATSWPRSAAEKPPTMADKVVILTAIGRKAEADSIAQRLKAMGYREPIYLQDVRNVS